MAFASPSTVLLGPAGTGTDVVLITRVPAETVAGDKVP